jgi:glutaredoxin
MYTVYSKDNCVFCTRAKQLLDRFDYQYQEIRLGEDITREEFLEKYPDQRTMPLIISEESGTIGGYQQLVEHLK